VPTRSDSWRGVLIGGDARVKAPERIVGSRGITSTRRDLKIQSQISACFRHLPLPQGWVLFFCCKAIIFITILTVMQRIGLPGHKNDF